MQLPLSINVQGRPLTGAMETEIRHLAEDLACLFDKIISCRIVIKSGDKPDPGNTRYAIVIDLRLPWGHLSIQNSPHRHLATAVHQAFRKARMALKLNRHQDAASHVEAPAVHPPATIDFLDKTEGYGYIRTWDDRRVYFDRQSVMNGGFRHLHPGMAVRFLETLEGRQQRIRMLSPV